MAQQKVGRDFELIGQAARAGKLATVKKWSRQSGIDIAPARRAIDASTAPHCP